MIKKMSEIFSKIRTPLVNNKNGFFDDFYEDFFCNDNFSSKNSNFPRINTFNIDVIESDRNYIVKADLPGFVKENIKVRYEPDLLTISGYKNSEGEVSEKNYIRRERSCGKFKRSFTIMGINEKNIDIEFKNGVLKVTLEKI